MRDLPVVAPPEHLARLIEIQYGDIAPFQWVRETWKNAQEAGATRLHYGIEWHGVASQGVYRRYIADNGDGMDPDELIAFFSQIGESGKHVGTRWDNLGWGAKLNLIPWNPLGVVIASYAEPWDGAVIHIRKNPDGYGLRTFETDDGPTHVVEPYFDEDLGVDLAELGPDWVREEGGTVILCVGSEEYPDTILGDPNKQEGTTKGVNQYLNTRLASTDMTITAEAVIHTDRRKWPKSEAEAITSGPDRNLQKGRNAYGIRHYLNDRAGAKSESPMELPDGSTIEWWLASKLPTGGEGDTPPTSFVAFEYDGEVYSVKPHRSALQAFGIYSKDVYKRTSIVIKLPMNQTFGTTIDRTRLSYADTGEEVAFNEWADWFSHPENFPAELASPLETEPEQSLLENGRFSKMLNEKYGERLRRTYLSLREGARARMNPVFHKKTKKRGPIVNPGETHAQGKNHRDDQPKPNAGPAGGNRRGVKYEAAADIPSVVFDSSDYDSKEPVPAVFYNQSTYEAVIYTQHPIVRSQVEYWQGLYPRGTEDTVKQSVWDWYRQDVALRIAHVESLAELYTEQEREKMLSEEALTASLLGLAKDDAVLKPKIGGLLQTKSLA
jgi:hypothetical protein